MDPARTRLLIIEDLRPMEGAFGQRLRRVSSHLGRPIELTLVHHAEMEAGAVDGPFDVVFVDAFRPWQERKADPLLPLFAGLWIAVRASRWRPRPRIVGYSGDAEEPEVNIAFREIPGVVGVYDSAALLDHLGEALWGSRLDHQVPVPTASDYARLGVLPSAQLVRALDLARRNDEAWELVARPNGYVPGSVNVRRYFRDKIAPLVPLASPGNYRQVVRVLRQVAGFSDAGPGR